MMLSINTDYKKLVTRIDTHKQYSTYDINEWMISCVTPQEGEKLLDIGCGIGEQLLSFGKICGSDSSIVAIDESEESLQIAKKRCLENNLKKLNTFRGSMDNLSTLLGSLNKFDIVISCFALYYSKNIPKLITNIKKILATKGKFFVCGPVSGNNAELIDFHFQVANSQTKIMSYPMTEKILPEITKNFSNISKLYFSNPIHFPDSYSLVKYWKAYYLYDALIEKEFTSRIEEYFKKHKEFICTKKVLGIVASQ